MSHLPRSTLPDAHRDHHGGRDLWSGDHRSWLQRDADRFLARGHLGSLHLCGPCRGPGRRTLGQGDFDDSGHSRCISRLRNCPLNVRGSAGGLRITMAALLGPCCLHRHSVLNSRTWFRPNQFGRNGTDRPAGTSAGPDPCLTGNRRDSRPLGRRRRGGRCRRAPCFNHLQLVEAGSTTGRELPRNLPPSRGSKTEVPETSGAEWTCGGNCLAPSVFAGVSLARALQADSTNFRAARNAVHR